MEQNHCANEDVIMYFKKALSVGSDNPRYLIECEDVTKIRFSSYTAARLLNLRTLAFSYLVIYTTSMIDSGCQRCTLPKSITM